jgi:Ca2+-binding EF-hand superfamily protein
VIQSAFATFDRQQNGTIQVEEVGTIMRWLGQFPAEQTLTDVITKQLIEECHGKEIAYEAFERVMLKCLIDHAYDPDDQATLLTAFRTMDTEGRGYVEVETLRDWLSAGHQGLREKELNEFVNFAKDLDEPEKVYYEDYVWKLHRSIQSHVDRVYAHVRASAGHGRKH